MSSELQHTPDSLRLFSSCSTARTADSRLYGRELCICGRASPRHVSIQHAEDDIPYGPGSAVSLGRDFTRGVLASAQHTGQSASCILRPHAVSSMMRGSETAGAEGAHRLHSSVCIAGGGEGWDGEEWRRGVPVVWSKERSKHGLSYLCRERENRKLLRLGTMHGRGPIASTL